MTQPKKMVEAEPREHACAVHGAGCELVVSFEFPALESVMLTS